MAVKLNSLIDNVLPCYFVDEKGIYSTLRRVPIKEDGSVEVVSENYEIRKIQWEWVEAVQIATGEVSRDLEGFNPKAVQKVLEGKQRSHKGYYFRKTNLWKERTRNVQ